VTGEAVVTVHVAGLTQVRETLERATRAVDELTAERNRYRDALRAVARSGPEYDAKALARDALDAIEQPDRGPDTSAPTTNEETT
jgi:hypothetical protein